MLLFTFLVAVCNVAIALVQKWISKKMVLLIVISAGALSTVGVLFLLNIYVMWILLLIYQVSEANVGIISAYGVELFPTQLRAMALSLIMLIGRVGAVLGTNIGGYLMEKNCQSYFTLFGGILLCCCACEFFLPESKVNKKKKCFVFPKKKTIISPTS